ncbi:hypothetical protein, partial [Pseudomonas sp. RSP]|uniref:hypothetical protein n=1 Tax=Pseudomonas sp. RSP TaxID=3462641 RepID=UPI004054075C
PRSRKAVMAESLNCVVYLLMKKPQELDRCPTFGAHFKAVIGGKPPPTFLSGTSGCEYQIPGIKKPRF